jgi:PIN domain nuclease of toxin-antitoxin system
MNNSVVADTMAVVLRLERRRLPQHVRIAFEEAENGRRNLYIPAMVLAEVGYLAERGRIEASLADVMSYIGRYVTIEVQAITGEVIKQSFEIDDIPELHDRIIAGTARMRQLPLITNDPVISDSQHVTVIW